MCESEIMQQHNRPLWPGCQLWTLHTGALPRDTYRISRYTKGSSLLYNSAIWNSIQALKVSTHHVVCCIVWNIISTHLHSIFPVNLSLSRSLMVMPAVSLPLVLSKHCLAADVPTWSPELCGKGWGWHSRVSCDIYLDISFVLCCVLSTEFLNQCNINICPACNSDPFVVVTQVKFFPTTIFFSFLGKICLEIFICWQNWCCPQMDEIHASRDSSWKYCSCPSILVLAKNICHYCVTKKHPTAMY